MIWKGEPVGVLVALSSFERPNVDAANVGEVGVERAVFDRLQKWFVGVENVCATGKRFIAADDVVWFELVPGCHDFVGVLARSLLGRSVANVADGDEHSSSKAAIAKSLVFRGKQTSQAVLVIASGVNRVNEKQLATLIGEPIEKPEADFVRAHTGYAIGGVPPLGHAEMLQTIIDEDLLQYDYIWAAAGTPFAVFQLTPGDLVKMTGGRVTRVK